MPSVSPGNQVVLHGRAPKRIVTMMEKTLEEEDHGGLKMTLTGFSRRPRVHLTWEVTADPQAPLYKGVAHGTIIRITVRKDCPEFEQKLVALHELAHALMPREHHSKVFYAKLFDLCRRHHLNLTRALKSESGYKPRRAAAGLRLSRQLAKAARKA